MDSRLGNVRDEELLARLAASFVVAPREPDAASLRQLSLAVADMHRPVAAVTHHSLRQRLGHRSLPRRLSPVATAGALVGALAMGTGISYAVGGPAPAAVRSVARSVGLAPPAPTPATPGPAVGAAQQAESTLHQALTNTHASAAAISHDTADLAHKLAAMDGDHTGPAQQVSHDGHHLLVEACQRVGGPQRANGTSGTTTSGTTTSGTTTPSGATALGGGPCASVGSPGPSRGATGSVGGSPGGAPVGPAGGTNTTTPSDDHGSQSGGQGQIGRSGSTPGTGQTKDAGGSTQGATSDPGSGGQSSADHTGSGGSTSTSAPLGTSGDQSTGSRPDTSTGQASGGGRTGSDSSAGRG